jgi:hypothetical protein
MADLPKDRLTSAPPFTYCRVDLFGPCLIKEGRKELKRYGVVFTCLASRAIHFESPNSLETDSFLRALRRFIARRSPIREMRSDRGTNLIGAAKELKNALQEVDHAKIKEYLCHHSDADRLIEWKPNLPTASHMGGVWERQIRTVRTILTSLIINERIWSCPRWWIVPSIVNWSRMHCQQQTLTFPSSNRTDLQNPLSPNTQLTMQSKVVPPPPPPPRLVPAGRHLSLQAMEKSPVSGWSFLVKMEKRVFEFVAD